jgi:hypothetical protein
VDDISQAAKAKIIKKRDAIVAERTSLLKRRAEIMATLRTLDRQLADCKAAARVFGVEVEFPEDERDEYERMLAVQRGLQRGANVAIEHTVPRTVHSTVVHERLVARDHAAAVVEASSQSAVAEPQAQAATVVPPPPGKKPTIREVAIAYLQAAGAAGTKASAIREHLETEHGQVVHDKTVGMTLYRLSKEGHAHRDKLIWFFGPPPAETKNPGGDAPGPNVFE